MSVFTRLRDRVRGGVATVAPVAGAAAGTFFGPAGTAVGGYLGAAVGGAVAPPVRRPTTGTDAGGPGASLVAQSGIDSPAVPKPGLSLPAKIGIGAGIGVAVLGLGYLLLRRRK